MFDWRTVRAHNANHYLLLRRGVVPHETTGDTDANRSGFALLRLRQRLSARKLRARVILAVAAAAARVSERSPLRRLPLVVPFGVNPQGTGALFVIPATAGKSG
jgi:hypothetical protein